MGTTPPVAEERERERETAADLQGTKTKNIAGLTLAEAKIKAIRLFRISAT